MSTTVLSTIPSVPSAPSAPEAPTAEAPVEASEQIAASTPEIPVEVAPEKPDPDLALAQKFESVSKREARARKAEAQWQEKLAAIEAKEKELSQKLADAEAALEDPIDWALKKGKDPVTLAKRFGQPMSEEEKRIAKLEADIAKDREERAAAIKQAEAQRREAEQFESTRAFVASITPDECPFLTTVHPANAVPGLVHGLLNRPQDPTDPDSPTVLEAFKARYNRGPTPKEIRETLEAEAESYARSLMERFPKPAPSQATPETPLATEESTSLSNQHAAASSSTRARTPSREERMRELKAQLEAEAATRD